MFPTSLCELAKLVSVEVILMCKRSLDAPFQVSPFKD